MKHRVLNPALWYPTDAAIIDRLLAGEAIPMADRGMVERKQGDVVDDIPACSVDTLIASGDIEAVIESSGLVDDEAAWRDLGRPQSDEQKAGS